MNLSDYFTAYERQIFFSRRTSAEQLELARQCAAMSPDDRTAFKRQLWATHRQQVAARKALQARQGHDALGTMLADLSRRQREGNGGER